jgi:hypothetical protein
MWLWIDVLIAYLIRISIRGGKLLRSRSWPVFTAKVMSAATEGNRALIYYQYFVDGESYADVNEKPFLWGNAKEYARMFERGDELYVRVKPGNPSVSQLGESGPRYHGNPKRE